MNKRKFLKLLAKLPLLGIFSKLGAAKPWPNKLEDVGLASGNFFDSGDEETDFVIWHPRISMTQAINEGMSLHFRMNRKDIGKIWRGDTVYYRELKDAGFDTEFEICNYDGTFVAKAGKYRPPPRKAL